MKKIKEFNEYVNESEKIKKLIKTLPNVAVVDLSTSWGGGFATIIYGGEEIEVDEEESLRKTWQNILDIARSMGAETVYSLEDDVVIDDDVVSELDDSPSGW